MPVVQVEDQIKNIIKQIEEMRAESLRLEGAVATLRGVLASGVKELDIPDQPEQTQATPDRASRPCR